MKQYSKHNPKGLAGRLYRIVGLNFIILSLKLGSVYAQCPDSLINTNLSFYPSGTTKAGGIITLPPVRLGVSESYIIPLLDVHNITSVQNIDGCSEIQVGLNVNNPTNSNQVNVTIMNHCPSNRVSAVSFTYHIENGSCIDDQDYIVPVIRDSVKIVLALDISGSMGSIVPGGSNTRIQALKDAVSSLIPKLEISGQPGDSLGITYYSTIVYQPSTFTKDFIAIKSAAGPCPNASSYCSVKQEVDSRIPMNMTAMGLGLLDAKNKLKKHMEKAPNTKRMVILFASGVQDYGNLLKPDGVSFLSSNDSLNNNSINFKDSIIYITVSITSAADVSPLMAAIAYKNNGVSLICNGYEFTDFLESQLYGILWGNRPKEIATRITNLTPLNGAEGISSDQNISLDFNEKVNIANGNVYIKRYKDDSLFEQIDITSGKVTGNGTSTLVINPSVNFENLEKYYVVVDAGAVVGKSGNPFAGITSKGYWSFTIKNVTNSIPISKALDDEIKIYSSQGNIKIQFQNFESGRYANVMAEIYSIDGKLIQQKMLNSPINTITTNHAIDVFIIKLVLKDAVFSKKIFNQ